MVKIRPIEGICLNDMSKWQKVIGMKIKTGGRLNILQLDYGEANQWNIMQWCSHFKKLAVLQKVESSYYPEILLGIYWKELKTYLYTQICTPMFIATLPIIAKKWKRLLCLSIDECINRNGFIIKRNEVVILAIMGEP